MSFGLILIEVCDINLACTPELLALEEEFPDVSIIENGCMSHCDLCATSPYVFLNGEIIRENTVDKLLGTLRNRIDELTASLA
jgi:uncharacterized protein YuzB (UPF0349 family)